MKKLILLTTVVTLSFNSLLAQSNTDITGFWMNEKKTRKVEVYKTSDNKYEGKIVWLKDDAGNHSLGDVVIKDLSYENGNYDNGKVYAEKAGGWINCEARLENDTTLKLTASKLFISRSKLYYRVNN